MPPVPHSPPSPMESPTKGVATVTTALFRMDGTARSALLMAPYPTANKIFRMTRRLSSRLELGAKLAVIEASLLTLWPDLYLEIFGMIDLPLNECGFKLTESKLLSFLQD